MYYILTPSVGLSTLAQEILFKKGYRWSHGETRVYQESFIKVLCFSAREGCLRYLDKEGDEARDFMRRARTGAQELTFSDLVKL